MLRVQPDTAGMPFLLALFTILELKEKELPAEYGQRWNIETDLRTLKRTLRLDQLTCSTPDMVAKEIDMGIAVYNLVRAATCLASQQSGIPPRGYSFTRVFRIMETFTPLVVAAVDPSRPSERCRTSETMRHWASAVQAVTVRATPSRPRSLISCSRIRNFCTFLLTVIGNPSTNRTYCGTLK